jgi:hypothetical protein
MDDIAEAASAPDAVHVAIVSYGYGRFVPDVPDVDDWTEEADVGFANRLLLQQYLPQRGVALPEDYTADDPAGVVATAPSDLLSLAYCYYVDQFDTGDGDPDFQQFTALWRRNPRDGVWYVNYTLGPVPIDPLSGDPAVPLVVWEGQQPYTTGPPGTGNP